MFHVGMNIQDKVKLIREVKRVLRSDAIFAIYDVHSEVGSGELQYPLRGRAMRMKASSLRVDDYRQALVNGGFANRRGT